jgi:hypothetical protein
MNNIFTSNGGSVTINGVTYSGSVNISSDGSVIVNGANECVLDKGISITVEVSGDVQNIKTMSGDINVSGNIGGNVKTMSGDVFAKNIDGNVSTMSGDVTTKG